MADVLVAEGSVANIGELGNWDNQFAVGERGRLQVYLRAAAPSAMLSVLQSQLNDRGVLSTVAQEGRTVYINFTRGGVSGIGLWPALAAIAIVLMLVLAVLIVGWQLFKSVAGALGPVLPLLLLGVGVYLLVRTFRKKGKA